MNVKNSINLSGYKVIFVFHSRVKKNADYTQFTIAFK